MSLHDQLTAVLALLPSVFFLLWFLRAARQAPEPPRVVIACYLAGCAAFGIAVVLLHLLDPMHRALPGEAWMFLGVAPVEETLKLVAVILAAGLPARWGRMTSGLVYAIAASLGFAAVENIAYAERFGIETGLLRAFTAVPGHALHGALVGIQLGRAHRAQRSGFGGVLLGLALAVFAHGLYNTLLLEGPAVRMLVVPLLLVEGAILMALFQRAKAEDVDYIVAQLRRLPVLAAAPTSSLRLLATRALRRRLAAGDRVFREGDDSEAVYLVLGGQMSVDRLTADPNDGDAREHLANLDTGAFFGEMGVLMDRERSASVRAESDALVLELSRTGLHEAIAVVDGLAEELRDAARDRGVATENLPSVTQLHAQAGQLHDEKHEDLDPDSLVARLKEVPLLSGLRFEALQLLAAGAYTVRKRKRSRLLREGGQGAGLCVILEGRAAVIRGGEQVNELGPGDWFGEISLLTGFAATATVQAITPMELAVVDGSDLRGVIGMVPNVGVVLLDQIEERLARDGADRQMPRPGVARGLIAKLRRTMGGLGFARGEARSKEAAILMAAFPQLLELPTTAADALAELGTPLDGDSRLGWVIPCPRPDVLAAQAWFLPDESVAEALSRCPHLVHLLARQAARRARVEQQ